MLDHGMKMMVRGTGSKGMEHQGA